MTSDHVAVDLRKQLVERLRQQGFDVTDVGPESPERTDYPVWGSDLARAVAAGQYDRGIAICGSGVGISISANKVPGIRAACVSETYSAQMSRLHNDTNMLCFGSRVVGPDVAFAICSTWLETPFEGGRHAGRVAQLADLDRGEVPTFQTYSE
ncbi:ribose 5-phosphate isomerase B [Tessaracoccus sp. Y36]